MRQRQRFEKERQRADAVKSRCKRVTSEAAAARKLARTIQQEKVDVEAQAAKQLRELARQSIVESKRRERDAAQALKEQQAKVFRLSSQVTAAAHEAGVFAQREAETQKRADAERERAERELQQRETEAVEQRAQHLREQRESAKALQEARAKVLRLGSQVVSASHEAAIYAQREAKAIEELEQERARAQLWKPRFAEMKQLVSAHSVGKTKRQRNRA